MSRLGRGVGIVAVVLAVSVAVVLLAVRHYVHAPIGLREKTTFTVKRRATLKPALAELAAQGLVRHPRWLYWYARSQGRTTIRAGEYLAMPQDTPATLLTKLVEGRVKTEQFTIVEGYNRWLVREALARARWMGPAVFDRLCDDRELLARHGIPGPSCEGYLFPETYTLARGLAPEAIFGAFFTMFHKVYDQVTAEGHGPFDFGMRELATFASLIEKETGAPEERPHVACVFYNRLRAKPPWRLDTDPTVIYAATLADPNFDGNLNRELLHGLASPYNTYRVYGLPPGPIANAGRASFNAAVHPLECPDFFFVSMNNGRHVFCPTIGCHNRAKEKWQVEYFRKQRRSASP
jgi:UPF0755 protein